MIFFKPLIILPSLLFALTSFAGSKKHSHREHEAHVHGGGTLQVAFDGLAGVAEFKAASQGILGFEHQPKSDKDKKKLASAIEKFETGFGKMLVFDSSLNCVFTKEKIEMVKEEEAAGKDHDHKKDGKKEGEHSDFTATMKINCEKTVVGSKVTIDFTEFKKLKDLDVTILAGDLQKSGEYKGKPLSIELK